MFVVHNFGKREKVNTQNTLLAVLLNYIGTYFVKRIWENKQN